MSDDRSDLEEAIRLLRSLTLQWPSADRSVYWLANDEAAKMAELLAKYPAKPASGPVSGGKPV